ncbi:tyrosine-protein phosphatase [Paenibacillus sp. MBLB4367]|uniref:tyrosine-protein phosphatase n=1 Tax=Paenibacillus sp. MBLB4367 TaxID=3384767 RepID=UPI0039082A86
MIDIHSHILPGIDDGAQTLEESLEMARAAYADGIRTVIATPHHANGRYTNAAGNVTAAVASLNDALQTNGIDLQVLAGQEIRVYSKLVDDWHDQALLSLDRSSYILIEFPTAEVPKGIADLIHELRILGITPIIAHPERNQELLNKPDRLRELVELGALGQVTSHSITGLFGKKIQEISMQMCKSNLIHFVASDAHNMSNRGFGLSRAYETIEKALGFQYSEYYKENANSLITGEIISKWSVKEVNRKWFLFWKR